MKTKKVALGFIVLLILMLSIVSVSAVEENSTNSILTPEETTISSTEEANNISSPSDDSELYESENLNILEHSESEKELGSGEIDRIPGDNDYDNENYYDYVLEYKGKNITVEFTKDQIIKVEKGKVVEIGTGVTVKVPVLESVEKTTTKYVKTKIWAWKYYKNSKKIKWNKKYVSKTFKNAMKNGKYLKTYNKKTKYGTICYQTWKIPKKIKKTVTKKVYKNKEVTASMFKGDGELYPEGYWIGLGYDGGDREDYQDYKVNIISKNTNNNENNTNNNENNTTEPIFSEKTDAMIVGNTIFTKKSNEYFSLGVATFDEAKNKLVFHKNVNLIVKVKVGKKTTTYNVETNKKGIAKIFNVKNLKVGTYKITVKSNDTKFNVKEKGSIAVYNNKVKTITLKMGTYKKLKGDIIQTFVEPKNGQYKKGVYAECYNAKDPLDKLPHKIIVKAKFFFKNKKTGEIISKTYKSKTDIYGFYEPVSKLIKDYKPIKTKIYYCSM